MKKGLLLVVLALVLCLASVGVYGADAQAWKTMNYTEAVEAPVDFAEGNSNYPMASFCKIEDGALLFDSTTDPKATVSYKLLLNTPKDFKMTFAIRTKVLNEFGLDIDLRGSVRERIILKNGMIELNTSKSSIDFNTSEWHTYLITFENKGINLNTKIYVDGATEPVVSGISQKSDNSGYFRFGDGSSGNGYRAAIDWIAWTLDGAFTPDQVTLPEGFSLK